MIKGNRKMKNTVLKAIIALAVLMMLLSVLPSQAEINEKSSSLNEKVVCDDKAVECLEEKAVKCFESSDLNKPVKALSLAEAEKASDLLDTASTGDITKTRADDSDIWNIKEGLSGSRGVTDTLITYGQRTLADLYYSVWGGSAWGTDTNDGTYLATVDHTVAYSNPTRNEIVTGSLCGDATAPESLYVNVWNGDTNSWGTPQLCTSSTVYQTFYKQFDIAIESQSGDGIVFYGVGATLYYRIWNGATWGNEQSYSMTTITGNIIWVEAASDPYSDEIAVLVEDVNKDAAGIIWNGDAFGNELLLDNDLSWYGRQCHDVEYEQQSGYAMFVWGIYTALTMESRQWNGASWDAELPSVNLGSYSSWLKLQADPNSDQLILTSIDDAADFNTVLWSGSAWGTAVEHDSAVEQAGRRCADAIFETASGHSGHIIAAYGDAANTAYKHWDGSVWTGPWDLPNQPTDDASVVQLTRDDTGLIFCGVVSVGAAIRYPDLNTWIYTSSTDTWTWQKQHITACGIYWTDGGCEAFMVAPSVSLPAGNQTPYTPKNLGVQGYTSSPDILNITNHTPTFNYTYTDYEGDLQSWRNVTIYNITSGKLIWYNNVSDSRSNGANVTVTYNSTGTATADLGDGCDYYFNVTCNDTGSNNWSAVASVKFHMNTPPPTPTTPIIPTNGATGISITTALNWTAVTDAEGSSITYYWYIDNDEDFSSLVSSGSAGTNTSGALSLAASTKYYWRVRAYDGYEYGVNSTTWNFTTGAANNPPTLSNGAVNPTTGTTSTTFTYNVTYSDADGDAPSGIVVYILKTGSNITGSPFTMTWQSGSNTTGANYTYSTTLSTTGTDYTYYFNATDGTDNATSTASADAPDVSNSPPLLSNGAVSPTTGTTSTTFTYNVTYSDADGNAPTSIVVYILKSGANISGSPFAMTWKSGSNTTGANYTYSTTLSATGIDYTFYFNATDGTDNATPTASIDAPEVSAANNPPNPPTLTSPDNDTWTNDSAPLFDWDFSDDDVGDTQGGFHVQINSTNDFGNPAYNYNSSTNTSTFWDFPVGTVYGSLPDGTWYWRVKTKDNNGAWGEWSGWRIIKIDTQKPSVTINTPTPSTWYKGTISLNTTITDTGSGLDTATIKYKIDAGTWTTLPSAGGNWYTTNIDTTTLSVGSHTIYIIANDTVTNSNNTESVTINVDNTKPSVTINTPTPSTWYKGTISLNTTITDTGSGLDTATIKYKIDAGTWTTLPSAGGNWYTTNIDTTTLSDGSHTIYVIANDSAGNSNSTESVAINVDNTAPTVTSVLPAQGATNIAITTTITKTFSESMNQTSVEASFKVYQDGSADSLSGTYSWSGNQCIFTPSSQLSPNTKYWSNVSTGAKDLAGNPLSAANNTWFITAAGVGVTVNSPNGGEVWSGTHDISYTISGGTPNYQVWLNYTTNGGTTWSVCSGAAQPVTQTVTGIFTYSWTLPAGTDSTNCLVKVDVMDATPTTGTDQSNVAFQIDTIAPTVSSTDPANAVTGVSVSTNVIVTFSEGMNTADTETAFGLYKLGTITKVAGAITWNPEKTQLTFDPTANLDTSTKYYINITTGAKDDSAPGNALASAFSASFTTGAGATVTVNSPNGNEIWKGNTTYWINYAISGGAAPYTVKLYYSTTGTGGPWTFIAFHNQSAAGTFNYTWLTPTADSASCYVNVSVNDSTTSSYDLSNGAFTIDATPPNNPSLATEQNGVKNDTWQNSITSPTFKWSWPSDNLAGVDGFYWYFGTSSTGTSTNYIITNTSSPGNAENNTYYFRVRTRDKAGNNASWTTLFVFKHDAAPPTTTITISGTIGTKGWYISDVTVNLTVEENLSGLLKIEYRIYETWEPYVGNFPYTVEGNTTIYARTTDNAGNLESPWKYKFVLIDKTNPATPNLLAPENNTWTNNSIIFFDWNDSSDEHSKIANYTLQVSKDENFSYFNYTAIVTVSEKLSASLADGIYYWRVLVKDNASNNNISDVRIIKIDTVKPGSPTLISPVGIDTPDNTPTFEWTEVTDPISGLANYTIQVSKKASFLPEDIVYESNPTANTSTPSSTIDDGSYWWRVKAVDNAGNHGDWSSSGSFSITSGAVTGLELKINNGANYTNSTSVTLTISVDNPTADYCMCFSNDGDLWSDYESYSTTKTWDLTLYGGNATEGKKNVYVRCKKSPDVTIFAQSDDNIILDLTSPSITLQLPLNDVWVNYSGIEFKWKARDNFWLSGNYWIQIWNYAKDNIIHENLVSGSMINNETSTYSYSLPDGKYWWRVRAEDKAGNWCDFTNYWLLKIDTENPVMPMLILPINNSETNKNVVTFSWENLTDLSGVAYYTLQISRNPEFSDLICSVDTAINKTTQTLPEATYWWRVRANDNAGNVGDWSSKWIFIIFTGGPTSLQILINAGATETNNESVYLVVYAVNATKMCFSNDGNTWSAWENYNTIRAWTLETVGSGNKTNRTVYFKCRNEYKESTPVNDSILVNKKPPIVTITTPSQAINVSYITIEWKCDEPDLECFEVCAISSESSDGPKEWINVGKNNSYYFTNLEEGYHVIYVRGKRLGADEVGGAHSMYILIDSLPPANLQMDFLNTSVVNGIEYTNSTIINITLNGEDDTSFTKFVSGIEKFYLSNDNVHWYFYDYTGFPLTITWDLTKDVTDGDGSKTVYFKVVDKGGNWNIINSSVFLDSKKPINLKINMVHCDLFDGNVNTTSITLNLSAYDDGSGLWQMSFSENGTEWGAWVPYNQSYIYTFINPTSPIKIYFRVKDRAGNVNETSLEVGLPDLSITQILFEPSDTIPIGTTVLINVTISNIGENDAVNVTVWFYKYDPTNPENELGYKLIPFIGKGENLTVSLGYSQWETGSFPIWVWVDRENKIVEIREGKDNNSLSKTVYFVSSLNVLPTNITFSVNGAEPSYIFEDDAVIITAEIINLGGNIKIPFWVEFWFGDFENNNFNGSLIGKTQVENIFPYETKRVSIIWNAEEGNYKIWVFLNTTNLPNENVEDNWFNGTFRVYPPTAIEFQVSVSLLTTDPSGTLSYTITITNIGQISDTYNLTVEDLPSGWDYSFIYNGNEIENVTLEPGDKIEILLKVKSSDKPGTYRFRVVASSIKDSRAVYDTELTAKIKEPFPWYLLIIAVIAAAIIAVICLLVKKGVLVVKAKPAVKIEPGYNYLIKGTDVRKAYDVFMSLTKKTLGLCITSTHPRKRRDEYKLSCPVYWLTDVTKTDEKTLHPERLDFELFKTVNDFVTEKHGVIMLDGLEYLIHVNGFERTMDFIDSIRDAISTHKGTLVVPANPSVFKEEELGMLEKRFDRILG